ncbi:ATP-grasp domain-containing protein [Hyphomonas pacifica]|uniref:Prokaryotic glutathione synthetase ATP-binding domain-containing protein n=2 Tax=Hyphomonas pacifica TaxID=1280941 RepID=A0A8B2PM08_9PROT|nr:hypothetical protein [Hyphomonas pacifica]RAN31001.1 hypothetical protein HY3_05225 [Hyphomonas pacifica]
MMRALRPEFGERGMQIVDVCWDDPNVQWTDFAAAMIGTTWDYWDRQKEFLKTLERVEQSIPLYNASALVRWNSHKSYLRDLESKGARLIPTLWINLVTDDNYSESFSLLDSDDLVFKRQVGAGAAGQFRLSPSDAKPDMPHPMMVQPFLPMIQEEGELSFIFVDGEFSHALIKRAKTGDYRIQSSYGGQEEKITPSISDLEAARQIMQTLDSTPLYARVDMIRDTDGALLLMELELIEPYLYPEQGPQLGGRLAKAVASRLKASAGL